jgi:small nuclear ribonucleoprotein
MSSEIDKILDGCINKAILIKLKNQTIIRGNLQAFDQHMNLLLTKVQDISEDKVKNLDKIILRGDNILIVSLS